MSLYLISFIIFIINPVTQSQICGTQSSVSGVISILKDNENSSNECHYVGQKNNLIIRVIMDEKNPFFEIGSFLKNCLKPKNHQERAQ